MNSVDPSARRGVLAAGNYIVDRVKLIDRYPEPETLADILESTAANGGGPYNLLKDLATLAPGLPLFAAGCIGDDDDGRWILEDCRSASIDTSQIKPTDQAPTSYTDAMTEKPTGRRTFFHCRGANDLLVESDVDVENSTARCFCLGFLTLLGGLDELDGDGQTGAARLLARARAAGLMTVADLVSLDHPHTRSIVAAAAPHLDVLFINERELGMVLDRNLVEATADDLEEAAREALSLGAGSVVVHCTQGAVAVGAGGADRCGSVRLPAGFIAGSTGAGDAFAAGYLLGLHEGASVETSLRQAVCSAAMSLSAPSASDGMQSLEKCLALGERHGYRDF